MTTTLTKAQITSFLIDVEGQTQEDIDNMFNDMKEFGVPIQDYLTHEQLELCKEYSL